jgi:hypothetical protein
VPGIGFNTTRRRFVRPERIAVSGVWQAAGGMRLRPAPQSFRVAYAVWRVRKGTLRLLKRYPPAHVQVRA